MMPRSILIVLFLFFFFSHVWGVETIIFNDNFSSGSLAGYDTNAGVWSAATNQLVGGALDGAMISHAVNGMIGGRTYRMYYKNDPAVGGLNNQFFWFTDQNGPANINGYGLLVQSGVLLLRKYVNGSGTNLISSGGVSTGSLHDVNILHTFDGNISLWLDGVAIGSAIDTTYSKGTKIGFNTSNGVGNGIWDDVNILFTGDTNTTFRFVDEVNNSIHLQPTLTLNGQSWPVNADGNFDINSAVTFPLTITASLTNYSTRTYKIDTNQALYSNTLFGLRSSSQARTISFTFFAPNQISTLPNQYIRVIKGSVLSQELKTDSTGGVTFSLAPQDSGYSFKIYSGGSDTNLQYTYSSIPVTVNRPIDESTLQSIPGGFNIDVGGLGTQSYSDVGNTGGAFPMSSIYILGNTNDAYTLRVQDNNSNGSQYYARKYIMQAKGSTSTLTIQPYLISIINGILVNVKIIDSATNVTIAGLRTTLTRGISGNIVTVEDNVTDIIGVSQLVMLSQQDYNLSVTNTNQTINYFAGPISPVTQTITIIVNFTTSEISYGQKTINLSISPSTSTILATGPTTKIDFNISTNYDINLFNVQALDNNVIEAQTSSASNPFNGSFTLTLANFDSNTITLKFIIVNSDSNTILSKTYIVIGKNNQGVLGFRNLGNNITQVSLAMLIIAMMIGTIFFLGNNSYGNNDAQVFPVAIVGGILFYILIPSLALYFMGGLLAAGIAWMWVRSVK